jgi:hypothetical protein
MNYRNSTLLTDPTRTDIPADLCANDPVVRLAAARNLSDRAEAATTRRLVSTAPIRPWPYGMPTVANPWVVVLGVSPGDVFQTTGHGRPSAAAVIRSSPRRRVAPGDSCGTRVRMAGM